MIQKQMMEKQYKFRIVVTGPESSGKTTLAEGLAEALQTPWTPEFARFYVAALPRPYRRADLPAIARGQAAWEQWYAAQAGRLLICDTDWTVLDVWDRYRFPHETPRFDFKNYMLNGGDQQVKSVYLLCAPDIPWAPDPLREHPQERGILFEHYRQLLENEGAAYHVMRGNYDARLANALQIIQNLS